MELLDSKVHNSTVAAEIIAHPNILNVNENIKTYSIVLCVIVTIWCLAGNAVVLWTMIKSVDFQKHTKNYFLLSITIADLLVGICMPSSFFFKGLAGPSQMTAAMCKSMSFLQGVAKTSSIYSFTIIAIER